MTDTICGPPIVLDQMAPIDLGRAEERFADAAAEMRHTAEYLDRTARHLRARRLPIIAPNANAMSAIRICRTIIERGNQQRGRP